MRGVRSVAVGAWVRQGSALESAERMGASHLLEHMVFRGTENRSRQEIALALESLGGSLNAYTSREHTGYEARVLADHLPQAAEVLSDLGTQPAAGPSPIWSARGRWWARRSRGWRTRPDDLVFELHGDRMWRGHPYGYSILGTRDTVGAITREDLAALHRTSYVGTNLVGCGCRVRRTPTRSWTSPGSGSERSRRGARPQRWPTRVRSGRGRTGLRGIRPRCTSCWDATHLDTRTRIATR